MISINIDATYTSTSCHFVFNCQRYNMYIHLNKAEATFTSDKEYIFNISSRIWLQGSIGLCEIEYSFKREKKIKIVPKYFDICCDLCDTSLLNGNKRRRIKRK